MSSNLPEVSQVIHVIQQTLAEFRQQCAEWEHEVEDLLDEVDALGPSLAWRTSAAPRVPNSPADSDRGRASEDPSKLHARQESISQELADLKRLVMEQTAALSGALGT